VPKAADWVLGLDSSTSGCKAVVWDSAGNALGQGRAGLQMQMPQPGWHEQDANDWWSAACSAMRQALIGLDASRVRAACIAHQRETFVPVDGFGRPLRPAMLWLDQRAAPLLPDLVACLDPQTYHQRTGKVFSANLAPGKIEWLRRFEPGIFEQTRFYLDTHAFLVHRLTGHFKTSTASADPLGLYDFTSATWDAETLAATGIRADQLPEIIPTGQVLGYLTPQAAAETGLPAGMAVVAGIGDGQGASLGSGLASPRDASLSLGTSVIGGFASTCWVTSPTFRTMAGPQAHGYILETVLLGGSYTLHWLLNDLLQAPDFQSAIRQLEDAAAPLPPGSDGLLLLPYWSGVMNPYWDASASGVIAGLRGGHRREHIYRAILEGIAFELRLHLEGVEAALAAPVERILVSGGGAQSALWRAVLASVCGRQVLRCAVTETAALGAGILAAAAAGLHPSLTAAVGQMVRLADQADLPDPAQSFIYTQLYQRAYRPLYPALRSTLAALASLTGRPPAN